VVILTPENEEGQPIQAADLLQHLRHDTGTLGPVEPSARAGALESASTAAARNLRDARQEFEKEFILRTLKEQDWNVSRTASILGIERSHLHRKIKSYGIEAPGTPE
jgi:two-component system nitrogen regulation response regulator NtrX